MLLSNAEVASFLGAKKAAWDQRVGLQRREGHRVWTKEPRWVAGQVRRYVGKTRGGAASVEDVESILGQLDSSGWGLSRRECLQLLNNRACTPVEVHLIVDDCEHRFSDEEVEKLCGVIAQLPRPASSPVEPHPSAGVDEQEEDASNDRHEE